MAEVWQVEPGGLVAGAGVEIQQELAGLEPPVRDTQVVMVLLLVMREAAEVVQVP